MEKNNLYNSYCETCANDDVVIEISDSEPVEDNKTEFKKPVFLFPSWCLTSCFQKCEDCLKEKKTNYNKQYI